jgi:hypothetical protein
MKHILSGFEYQNMKLKQKKLQNENEHLKIRICSLEYENNSLRISNNKLIKEKDEK